MMWSCPTYGLIWWRSHGYRRTESIFSISNTAHCCTVVMSSLGRIWRDKILQLSTKIRLYQVPRDVRFVIRCRNLDITFVWRKTVGGFPHEVPTPNPAQHVTNAQVFARTGLPPVMDSTRRRRLSVFGHIARLTQGTPAHNALHCQVGLASGRSLGGDWRRRPRTRWTDQLCNDTWSVPAKCQPLDSGDRQTSHSTGPWWSDATARDDDDDDI